MLPMKTTGDHVITCIREVAEALGGEIREGSLVLIEGGSKE
jgi:hypothetical protein